MSKNGYYYGIPRAELKENLEEWLENPFWREYYETAPTARCRRLISLEFWESEYDSDAAADAIRILEKRLSVKDWEHLYRYCGNNPRKKYIRDRITDLEPDRLT